MKNTKKNIIAIGAVALLLGVVLIPNICAISLEGKTENTIDKKNIIKEYKQTEIFESEKESTSVGSIYGTTDYLEGWGAYPLPNTLLEARIGDTLIDKERSGLLTCSYELNLPIGQTYNITASNAGKIKINDRYYKFVGYNRSITLTADNPNVRLDFFLDIALVDSVEKAKNMHANYLLQRFTDHFPNLEKLFSLPIFNRIRDDK